MTTAQDVTALANSWVGQKITDPTNPYGGQCTTLVNQLLKRLSHSRYNLNWTNAKDGLTKAAAQGLEVVYNDTSNPNLIPQAGDFIVWDWGTDPFGHIGLCVSSDLNGMHTIEQNIDGYRDENQNGWNDQLEEDGGGYTRRSYRDYSYVVGWFRLPYTQAAQESGQLEENTEEQDMFTISAEGRGIALIQGGVFFALLDAKDPIAFWDKGVKHMQVSKATFDNFQKAGNSQEHLDDETVNKLIKGLK